MSDVKQIAAKFMRMRSAAVERDSRMNDIRLVRAGRIADVMPDWFSEEYPKSLAANFIDTAARDLSELMAPLPTLICSAGTANTKTAKDFASRKTNIGLYYWHTSRLGIQMFNACDRYLSYGFLPFIVEPNYDAKLPRIFAEDPMGFYYHRDRLGRIVDACKVFSMKAEDLAAMWPEYETQILRPAGSGGGNGYQPDRSQEMLEVVRFYDKDQTVTFVPHRQNLVLGSLPQRLKKCPVVVVERPGLDGENRGQFDDAIPVQVARAKFALLGLEAATKSVQAPLAVPDDVNEIAIGSDAVIRSRNPEKIRKVGMELPPGAFQESQLLEGELRMGARYPEGRSGDSGGASVITGRGVQALLGTIDTQVKTAQSLLAYGLQDITSLSYELDVTYWPNDTRTIQAVYAGSAFSETYTPSKDIKDDFRCDCVYGFAAGLGVNQAVVMIEQMINGGLISRATGRRHLPLGEDPIKLEREILVQQVRDGLMQGVQAMAQSANVVMEQGGDPSSLLMKVADIAHALMKGDALEDVVSKVFAPPPAPPESEQPGAPGEPGAPPGPPGAGGEGGAPMGMSDQTGLPINQQAGQGPGGRPPLQQLLAGLSNSGKAQISDNVQRRVPSLA